MVIDLLIYIRFRENKEIDQVTDVDLSGAL